jgi:hypothetical protein
MVTGRRNLCRNLYLKLRRERFVNCVLTVMCRYCNVWQSCVNSTYSNISINISDSNSRISSNSISNNNNSSSSSNNSYRSRERIIIIIIITMTSVIKMSLLPYQVGRLLQSLSIFGELPSSSRGLDLS